MRSSAVLLATFLTACAGFDRAGADELVPSLDTPAEIHRACELTAHRCTRCHTLDRILDTHANDPGLWRATVHRMRLLPGSDIPPDEEPTIERCLDYHSFGAAP
jgi:hypothetical protein